MNYSSNFNQLNSLCIIKKLSSRDFTEQQDGINLVKKMLENLNLKDESLIINLIPMILELSSEKKLLIEIELLCGELIKKINPYAFELIFKEISKTFDSVKFHAKIQGLKMIGLYAKTYPQIISSNIPFSEFILLESILIVFMSVVFIYSEFNLFVLIFSNVAFIPIKLLILDSLNVAASPNKFVVLIFSNVAFVPIKLLILD
jgi:hypothetical protein